jgi:hypothetical protein
MFLGELLCLLPHIMKETRCALPSNQGPRGAAHPALLTGRACVCPLPPCSSKSKSGIRRRAELAQRGPGFRARRILIFAIPAACDTIATTLLNVGWAGPGADSA